MGNPPPSCGMLLVLRHSRRVLRGANVPVTSACRTVATCCSPITIAVLHCRQYLLLLLLLLLLLMLMLMLR